MPYHCLTKIFNNYQNKTCVSTWISPFCISKPHSSRSAVISSQYPFQFLPNPSSLPSSQFPYSLNPHINHTSHNLTKMKTKPDNEHQNAKVPLPYLQSSPS